MVLLQTMDQVQICSICLSFWVLGRKSTWSMLFSQKRKGIQLWKYKQCLCSDMVFIMFFQILLARASHEAKTNINGSGSTFTLFHEGEGKKKYWLNNHTIYQNVFHSNTVSPLCFLIFFLILERACKWGGRDRVRKESNRLPTEWGAPWKAPSQDPESWPEPKPGIWRSTHWAAPESLSLLCS